MTNTNTYRFNILKGPIMFDSNKTEWSFEDNEEQ